MNYKRIIPVAVSLLALPITAIYAAVQGSGPSGDMGWTQTWQDKMNQFARTAQLGTTVRSPQEVIASLVQIVLGFVGIIFLVLIIAGGFMWMTSAGNEQKISKAKSLLTNAVIGLTITVVAYSIAFTIVRYLRMAAG
jgi:hypothetical protein